MSNPHNQLSARDIAAETNIRKWQAENGLPVGQHFNANAPDGQIDQPSKWFSKTNDKNQSYDLSEVNPI